MAQVKSSCPYLWTILTHKENMFKRLRNIIAGSSSRSILILKNIVASFFIKGWSALMQLALVPLTLACLNIYENGVWLTISSMLLWIDTMDIGLGNGLRNKLAEAVAEGNMKKAKTIVSSTFAMLVIIIVPVVAILYVVTMNANIYSALNVEPHIVGNLKEVVFVSILFVGATFIFKFIGNFYMGMQMPAVNNLLVTLGQTLAVAGTLVMSRTGVHSMLAVAIVNTASPLLVYLVSYPITFGIKYRQLKPALGNVTQEAMKEMCVMGANFFVLQISSILLFMSLNIVISKCFSPELVTPYQVAYRYFCLVQMVFAILSGPYWTATTDAFRRGEMDWIKASGRTLDKILLAMLVLVVAMVAFSNVFYRLWVGNGVEIPLGMTALVGAYMTVITVSTRYSIILNGMGKLRLQLYVTATVALLFIPCAVVICRLTGNINWLLVFMCLANTPGLIINYIQYRKMLNGTAHGVWAK